MFFDYDMDNYDENERTLFLMAVARMYLFR